MKREVIRQHANNGGVPVIDGQVTSDYILATEPPLPKTVTEDNHVWLICLAIIGSKGSAHDRVDSQNRKEVRCRNLRGNLFRLAVTG